MTINEAIDSGGSIRTACPCGWRGALGSATLPPPVESKHLGDLVTRYACPTCATPLLWFVRPHDRSEAVDALLAGVGGEPADVVEMLLRSMVKFL